MVVQAMTSNRQLAAMRSRERGATVRGATGPLMLLPDGTNRRNLVIGSIGNSRLLIIRDAPLAMATIETVDYYKIPETEQ